MFISTLNFFTIFTLSSIILFSSFANAEFYKYVDKNGNVRYVDDLGLVPKKDRGDIVTYEEKYDRLSPEERAAMIENEREFEKARKEFKKNKDAEKARREYLKKMTTPVRILQNQVFVPVTLGYKNNKIRT
ncbi:DUF4124 domain-containing protein, partial [Desulfobacterales bacterium HSG16]|nr:DUF4124 domain-containing protein [Desulfobacterales bacterium HSG16]